MGVYINMEMPKEGFVEILVRADGTVQQTGQSYRIDGTDYYTPYVGEMPAIYKAVPVPEQGRLIDADELKTAFPCGESVRTECIRATIDHAPTIIPADEPKEENHGREV